MNLVLHFFILLFSELELMSSLKLFHFLALEDTGGVPFHILEPILSKFVQTYFLSDLLIIL